MTTDGNLQFIRTKLEHIKSAVMYTMSNHVSRLPNDVILFLKADDYGQLWFTAHKPRRWVRHCEQSFPARLFFYKKGVDYYIDITGHAAIAGKEDLLALENEISPGRLLLKMTVAAVEYTETTQKKSISLLSRLQFFFSNLLLGKFQVNPGQQHISLINKTKSYG